MEYATYFFGTIFSIAVWGFGIFAVTGGLRQPTVGRMLATMRFTTWLLAGGCVAMELWLVGTKFARPDSWNEDEPPFVVAFAMVAALHLVCWLGLMLLSNTRLANALIRMHNEGGVVERDRERIAVVNWCRRFRGVYRVVCRWRGVDLDVLLASTLARTRGEIHRAADQPDRLAQ